LSFTQISAESVKISQICPNCFVEKPKQKSLIPVGVCRVLWFLSKMMAKAVVSHVTYKPKGFIMKPERNPQA
jgi:hypothetical protein